MAEVFYMEASVFHMAEVFYMEASVFHMEATEASVFHICILQHPEGD
jgi:hypothetical protein